MDATDNTGKARTPKQATGTNDDTVIAASSVATDRPFGPDGATILATEHWSLLGTRSLIWNEAMSRTTVFLTVLSAAIVALALLADATGFGPQTSALALVPLPGCCCWTSPPTCAWCRPTPRSSSWCWP